MSLRDVLNRELADLRSCGERVRMRDFEALVAWRCEQLGDRQRRIIASEASSERSLTEQVRALIGELDREHRLVQAPEPEEGATPARTGTPVGRSRARARRDTHRAA